MISVEEARSKTLNLVAPLDTETVRLENSSGRILAQDIVANRSQPPFASSAMDGYAVNGVEVEPDTLFSVVGEAAAGHGFAGKIGAGEAVRIFTGAPLPEGANYVVIQEDVTVRGSLIALNSEIENNAYVRPLGDDFISGDRLPAPRRMSAGDIALAASMNAAEVTVSKQPVVAIIATGDELVMPGETPGPDQIIASNSFGLKAMLEAAGAKARLLPIARDTKPSLKQAFELAKTADLIVTIGGASVGDHDLVADVAAELGMERAFYKIAMRPGKPLMAGRVLGVPMVGLPGNPVSSMVCGQIFLIPMIQKMLGLPDVPPQTQQAVLAAPVTANGSRAHYMRAILNGGEITPCTRQDSGLLTVLADANVLLIRDPNAPETLAGEMVSYLPI